jgi:aromatic ring-opening dioxygenase LigB subunit
LLDGRECEMPLSYACITPHGDEVIPELATTATPRGFLITREGMITIAKEVKRAKPDTIVIATPHNLRLWRKIGVVISENSSGKLQSSRGRKPSVHLKVRCDQEFARRLVDRATRRGLPVVGANYGSFEGPLSDLPMDWGTLVPLWFLARGRLNRPRVVIVTPSREIPLFQNYEFGRTIADLAERGSRRYVFVASADQAHAHKKSGAYGFNRAAAEYDRFVVDAIRRNRIGSVMNLSGKFVEAAKPDSLWQMTMLAGVLSKVKMDAELFSYQAPTYYGMICAGFRRTEQE